MELPLHHPGRVVQIANVAIMARGRRRSVPAAAEWLIGGLVLVGLLWPVLRADTGRALRDLGSAAVGAA